MKRKVKIEKRVVAELVEDMGLYPRNHVDTNHIATLAEALTLDVRLPMIRIARDGNLIVDGVHRKRAMERIFGKMAEVEVEVVDYESRQEMMIDAVELNSAHGLRLRQTDKMKSMILLQRLEVDAARIASLLHVGVETLDRWNEQRIAIAPPSNAGAVPGTHDVVLKHSVGHLARGQMDDNQVVAHGSAPGVSYLTTVRQIVKGLKGGIVNLKDKRMVEALMELRAILDDKLSAVLAGKE